MKPQANKTKTAGKPVSSKTGKVSGSAQSSSKDAVGRSANAKESFLKKVHICKRTFDYKDEQKDVKGKTERLNAIQDLQMML